MYAALRDCLQALRLDQDHIKAHLRLCRCLLELRWPQEAAKAIELFKVRFPEHAEVSACKTLVKDISEAIEAEASDDTTLKDHLSDRQSDEVDYMSSSKSTSNKKVLNLKN